MRSAGGRGRRASSAFLLAVAAVVGLAPAPAMGQEILVEARAGASVGNYTATRAGLDVAPDAALAVALEVWPRAELGAYASLRRASFGCEEGYCETRDVSVTSQSLGVGGIWAPGLPWLRAGVVLGSIDVDTNAADESSDPGLGIEAAAGLDFRLGPVRVRPGLTYLRHGASTDGAEDHVAVLVLEVGIAVPVGSF